MTQAPLAAPEETSGGSTPGSGAGAEAPVSGLSAALARARDGASARNPAGPDPADPDPAGPDSADSDPAARLPRIVPAFARPPGD